MSDTIAEGKKLTEEDLKGLIKEKLGYSITWSYFEKALWDEVKEFYKWSGTQHIFSSFVNRRTRGDWFYYDSSILIYLITPEWWLSDLCLGAMHRACRLEINEWRYWLHALRMAVRHFPQQVREILDGISTSDCVNN